MSSATYPSLAGRVVFVTGGATGIGAAFVESFHGQGAKVSIVKFRRRKHYLRQKNHRQAFTEVKVTDITAG